MSRLHAGCWAYIPKAQGTEEGWSVVEARDRVSTCTKEVTVGWRAIQALTPDATQMGGWKPSPVSPALLPILWSHCSAVLECLRVSDDYKTYALNFVLEIASQHRQTRSSRVGHNFSLDIHLVEGEHVPGDTFPRISSQKGAVWSPAVEYPKPSFISLQTALAAF